jgi:hypothetical protein
MANPLAAINGSYAGLFYDHDTNTIVPESSGLFTLQVGSLGVFIGKLTMNGASYSYHGQFNNQRQAALPVLRRQLTPVVLNLRFDPTDTTGQVRGSVTVLVSVSITNMVDGTNSVTRTNILRTAELLGYRNVFQSRSHPAPQAGARPFAFRRSDNLMVIGTNTATINTAGRVRFRGILNGRKYSMATSIGENGDSPFYLTLRPGSEAIVGWLRFPTNETMSYGTNLFWVSSTTNGSPLRLDAVPIPP